jgi:hypothetical protein
MPSTTRGYPTPTAGDDVDVPADMLALAQAIDTDVAGVQTAANTTAALVGNVAGAWHPLPHERSIIIPDSLAIPGTYVMGKESAAAAGVNTAGAHFMRAFGIDDDSLAGATGKAVEFRLGVSAGQNAINSGLTMTVGLHRVTGEGGAAAAEPFIANVAAALGSWVWTTPLANAWGAPNYSAAFSVTVSSVYCLAVVLSGSNNPNSRAHITAWPEYRLV